MTTTITLKTHDWPVDMITTDEYRHTAIHTKSVTHEIVAADSERTVHITDTRRVEFIELPLPSSAD